MSAAEEVRLASKRFYTALNLMANGDASQMADAWSHGSEVTAQHPIEGREVGWEAVRPSFEQFAQIATDGNIALKDQFIRVEGDFAYELGVEQGACKLAGHPVDFKHRVTNIYRREGGEWRMIHHHSDTSPAMVAVLGKLQAPDPTK
jgi:ketosteroid isomerase-like protein